MAFSLTYKTDYNEQNYYVKYIYTLFIAYANNLSTPAQQNRLLTTIYDCKEE